MTTSTWLAEGFANGRVWEDRQRGLASDARGEGDCVPDDEETTSSLAGLPHLADRLNVLFAQVPRSGSSQLYSNDRAAEDLRTAGVTVTGAYLGQLRSGKRNNPSARLLAAIADLFEVPITYFFDEDQADRIESQLATLVALRSAEVRSIVTRSVGVSEDGIANLASILEQLRRMEGLDDESSRS